MELREFSGKARHRVDIERPKLDAPNSVGDSATQWTKLVSVAACVEPLRQSEALESDQQTSTALTRFTVRYRSDVTTRFRIRYNGNEYDIQSVLDIESRHELLEIDAELIEQSL